MAVQAETTEPHSTYRFDYSVPAGIVVNSDVMIPVTFETDEPGTEGYQGVRFYFEAEGLGEVTFKATDSNNDEYTFTNSGYWGPAAGFDLPADYSATTDWTLNFSAPGTYAITFSLIEAPNGEVIADITETETVIVEAEEAGEATVDINPETLNVNSRGKWITAYIKLPAGYAVEDIDLDTVRLSYGSNELEADWGDVQDDVLMIKFDRATVAGWFPGLHNENVELTIGCEVNGTVFEGADTIRVINPPQHGKADGKVTGKDNAPGQNKDLKDNPGKKAKGKDTAPGRNK